MKFLINLINRIRAKRQLERELEKSKADNAAWFKNQQELEMRDIIASHKKNDTRI